jgi:hypothetical protein
MNASLAPLDVAAGFPEGQRSAQAARLPKAGEYFGHIFRSNRSVLELLDSNYTFVIDRLVAVYGITNITGSQLRLVTFPEGDLRGGVLTMGGVLTVTFNPTRPPA